MSTFEHFKDLQCYRVVVDVVHPHFPTTSFLDKRRTTPALFYLLSDVICMQKNEKNIALTGKRLKLAEMLANPSVNKSKKDIAEEVGISSATMWRWMQDVQFLQEVSKLVERYTDAELPYAWRCLLARMPVDTAAIKLYFELKGRYQQKVTATVEYSNPYAALTEEELRRLANGDDPKGGPDTG